MSEAGEVHFTGRRRFLQLVGLAGLSATVARPVALLAQTPPPAGGVAPATPPTTPPAEQKISDDARALADILKRRFPDRFTGDQLESMAKDFDGDIGGGKRLRDVKLDNSDEPDFLFRP